MRLNMVSGNIDILHKNTANYYGSNHKEWIYLTFRLRKSLVLLFINTIKELDWVS